MNKRMVAGLVRVGVFCGAVAGIAGLASTHASADSWGAWAPFGALADCFQSPGSAPGTLYLNLSGYGLANENGLHAIAPCHRGTFNPADLAAGYTETLGWPQVHGQYPSVIAQHNTQTQTVTPPTALTHSICQVWGYQLQ